MGEGRPRDPGAPGGVCPVICGPTAVGKTGLIAALARELPLEVISLDSRQIYRGLRIGTAQPTAAERDACPHHLIDFVDPDEAYDAARFRRDFAAVHREITARGGRPVLVGGAGLYLTAVREGFMDVPGSSPERLAVVRREMDGLADDEIRRRLERADPAAWRRIHPNDRYRSQRALEVHALTGRPLSELQQEQTPRPVLDLEFPTFVLERPTSELDARIATRTDAMLDSGWIEETEDLRRRHADDGPGLASIGYREIIAWLDGKLPRDELAPAIVRVTRQYAKRQRTWFRHVPARRRAAPEDAGLRDDLLFLLKG